MNKKINSYAIAIAGLIALILVFGITLTSGASQEKNKSNQEITDLKNQIVILNEKVISLQKSDKNKSQEITSLAAKLKELQKEIKNQSDNSFQSNFSLTKNQKLVKTDNQSPKSQKLTRPEKKKYYTSLEIAGFATYEIEFLKGQTALSQLKKAAEKYQFTIKTTEYSFGAFVDCIGGICGDSNHFWALYKNGEMSMVGAADLFLSINDKISWVYTGF